MASRVLTWHTLEAFGNQFSIGPTFYMEADYTPIAVRIKAENSPVTEDAKFDIFDDGVSIFSDHGATLRNRTSGVVIEKFVDTTIGLAVGDTEEVDAESFSQDLVIEQGSWISCNCIADGNGKNFTVHLELWKDSEEDESED